MSTDKKAMIFAQHPTAKGFWFSGDDQAFYQEGDAKNHDKEAKWEENPNYKASAEETANVSEDDITKTPETPVKKIATKKNTTKTAAIPKKVAEPKAKKVAVAEKPEEKATDVKP